MCAFDFPSVILEWVGNNLNDTYFLWYSIIFYFTHFEEMWLVWTYLFLYQIHLKLLFKRKRRTGYECLKKKWPTGIDQMLQTSPGIRETVRMLLLLCSHFSMFRKSSSFWSEIGINSKAIRMKLCSMNHLVLKKKNQMFQYTFHIDKKKS